MKALLGIYVGTWNYPTSYTAHAYVAHATVAQQTPKGNDLCGWIGVAVSPMTAAFAESLGMAEPYGAIFEQPEPGSPAIHFCIFSASHSPPLLVQGEVGAIPIAPGEVQRQHTRDASSYTQAIVSRVARNLSRTLS